MGSFGDGPAALSSGELVRTAAADFHIARDLIASGEFLEAVATALTGLLALQLAATERD